MIKFSHKSSKTTKAIQSFAVKVGLASAAVYYIKEQGVWRNSDESIKSYERLKETVKPYVEDVKYQIPIELPTLPATDSVSSLVKQSWNTGVLATFKSISELPETISRWTANGYKSAMQNPGFKDLIESFSSKSSIEKK